MSGGEFHSDHMPPEKEVLQVIRGLPITTWFPRKRIEEILEFMPADDDVIIATYPKTGTTWMQYIVHQILTNGESVPNLGDLIETVSPYLELTGLSAVEAMTTRPRVYKHHFPYNMVQKNPKAKIIYMYRRPEDTFVSYFKFWANLNVLVELDSYFESFITGNISYGRYFEHVLSYLKHIDDGNILMVSYEKLHVQRKEEILRVAKFLGEEYYTNLINNETVLNKIMEHTSFDYMQKNLSLILPVDTKKAFETGKMINDTNTKEVVFFRKGRIGDGKHSLSENQLKCIREITQEMMKGTDILSEWMQE